MLTPTSRSDFRTLLDAVEDGGVIHDGDRPAIIYLETGQSPLIVSRRAFRETIKVYAATLQELGVARQDLVVIAHTQNLEGIYLFWGALLAGAIPSMFPTLTEKLDAEIYMNNMADLVRLSGVRAVLTDDEFAADLAVHLPCPVYGSTQLTELNPAGKLDGFVPYNPEPNEIALLQHSSGTTGLQKGVALSHQAVLNQLANYAEAIALVEKDIIVSWLPLYHDMGLIAGFLLPLVQGLPLVLMSPFDWVQHPAILFRAIHEYHGTLCWLPNFAYNHCARRIRQRDVDGLSAASMRMFVNCSEPVYLDSHRLFLERFAAQGVTSEMLSVSYAMAENTFAVTQTAPRVAPRLDIVDRLALEKNRQAVTVSADHPNASIRVSCGRPISGTAVRVVDEYGNVIPDRHVGEVALQSDCMLSGYYQRPELNPIVDGWYQTGDMGYLSGGELFVVGRYKDLIINAGKNIYPQDIEAIVNDVPGVHSGRAAVFGVPDEREGTELIAVVAEVKTEDSNERKQISTAIRQAVVRQSLVTVSFVHLVGPRWLIKTSSGKVARSANRDKWLAERGLANETKVAQAIIQVSP